MTVAAEVARAAQLLIDQANTAAKSLQTPVYNVIGYGAVPGGIVDATAGIQAAVAACHAGGTVTGNGLTYLVSSILLKSDITFQDFNFLTKPTSISGDFFSPVTIGAYGDTTTRKNIRVRRVSVDGQRTKQTNLAGPEDSGRHGFRIIGCVDNVLIEDCSAAYCAADGIALYSGIGTRPADKTGDISLLTNITVKNCTFEWNRRHGGSGDSIQYALFENCRFNYNGRDVNGGVTEGDKGALAGVRYGNGFDMEGYGIGSFFGDIYFTSCVARQNVRSGIIFYDPTDPTLPGFAIRKNLNVISCVLDQGTEPLSDAGFSVSSSIANKAKGYIFKDVLVQGSTVNGAVTLRSVDTVTFTGGSVNPVGANLGTLDTCRNVVVSDTATYGKRFYVAATNYLHRISGERTLAPNDVLDLGFSRTGTIGVLRLTMTGGSASPVGGVFAVDIFLNGGTGFTVHDMVGAAQISPTGAVQVVVTDATWKLKNVNANAFRIAYSFTGTIIDEGTPPNS